VAGLSVAAALALLVITPSVGDAAARTRAAQQRHGTSEPPGLAATPAPGRFAAALIATEDARFFTHPGVDGHGVARAAVALLTGAATDPGGSTLDQQLVKQLYFAGQEGGVWATAAQLAVAVKLDTRYSKPEILDMYCDVVYFGHGFYGLDAAAHGYFGLAPDRLGWGQAAMLAGLIAAPTDYDPLTHLDLARESQHHVLTRLVETGTLTATGAAAAAAAPLHLTH